VEEGKEVWPRTDYFESGCRDSRLFVPPTLSELPSISYSDCEEWIREEGVDWYVKEQ
jgi:hypothetical protein